MFTKFCRISEMIGRSGPTRQAERTSEYVSIAEEGSVRLIKVMFAIAPYLCNLWNKACIANRTSLTLVLLVHGLNNHKGSRAKHQGSRDPSKA